MTALSTNNSTEARHVYKVPSTAKSTPTVHSTVPLPCPYFRDSFQKFPSISNDSGGYANANIPNENNVILKSALCRRF